MGNIECLNLMSGYVVCMELKGVCLFYMGWNIVFYNSEYKEESLFKGIF